MKAVEGKVEEGRKKEKEGNICTLGLPCCQVGLKVPEVCVLTQAEFLCLREAAAFPFAGPVPGFVCACCAFQCAPEVGFLKPMPSEGGAPESETLER